MHVYVWYLDLHGTHPTNHTDLGDYWQCRHCRYDRYRHGSSLYPPDHGRNGRIPSRMCFDISSTHPPLPDTTQLFWLANATYPCSTAFIKLALLFQFLRIYERGTRLWLTAVLISVFTALWGVAYGFLAWVPTVPVDAYWDLTRPAARYAYGSLEVEPFVATYETHAAINMLLDAVVLGVAVPMFFRPGIRKNSFWGLLSLFVLGGMYVLDPPLPPSMVHTHQYCIQR